jgi:putative endonuclease
MSTEKGRKAEAQAVRYLERHGYRVLARNVRGGRGELDIIARMDDILVFVEVKAHKTRESSLEAVHRDKCERIRSAAQAWLMKHAQYARLQCRFDLLMLTPKQGLQVFPKFEHLQDIFR